MKIKERKSFVILFVSVAVIIILALLSFVVVRIVSDNYRRFYEEGRSAGYNEGFSAGEEVGRESGHAAGEKDGYNSRNAEVSQLKVKVKNLENDYDSIYDEYLFYHRSAVIVTTAGEKYHHYGCYHISGSPFYIFNTEAAKARGYTPCLDCSNSFGDLAASRQNAFSFLAENK